MRYWPSKTVHTASKRSRERRGTQRGRRVGGWQSHFQSFIIRKHVLHWHCFRLLLILGRGLLLRAIGLLGRRIRILRIKQSANHFTPSNSRQFSSSHFMSSNNWNTNFLQPLGNREIENMWWIHKRHTTLNWLQKPYEDFWTEQASCASCPRSAGVRYNYTRWSWEELQVMPEKSSVPIFCVRSIISLCWEISFSTISEGQIRDRE